jgi:type VI secretion system secreted protein VgrG
MSLKQQQRMVGISTALGPDVLALRSFSLQEQLSRPFRIEAELSSEDGEIDFDKVVGHNATIRLNLPQKEKRYFDGIVSRLVQVGNQGGYSHYRATIVPWLWLLSRTSDCRIFQEKTVPEIIEEVFKGHGFNDYQLKLSGSYAKWEYCVQYRETDFNFVNRLMEQEGIYFFFEHE